MYYFVSSLINFLTCFGLALLVYFWNRQGRLNKAFAIFTGSVAIWALGYTFWQFYQQVSPESEKALFWIRFAMIGATLIPVTFTEFVIRLIDRKKEYRLVRRLNMLICGLLILSSYTPLFIKGVFSIFTFRYWPEPGLLLHSQLLIFATNILLAHLLLIKKWRNSSGITKRRIGFVFLGAAIGFGGGLTNYFLWYRISIPPIGNIGVSICVAVMAYAIVRYRLLDIETAAFYVFLLLLVYIPILGIPFWMGSWLEGFLGIERAARYDWVPLVVMAVLASSGPFIFLWLRAKAEHQKDQERLEQVKELRVASDYMVRITELDMLLRAIVHRLVKALHVSYAAIYLREESNGEDSDKKGFRLGRTWSPREKKLPLPGLIQLDSEFVQLLSSEKFARQEEPLEREAIEYRSSDWGLDSTRVTRLGIELFGIDASVVIPAYEADRKLFGFLVLGKTHDGRPLYKEVLQELVLLSNQAVAAIKNNQAIQRLDEFYHGMQNTEKLASIGMFISSLAHDVNNPLAVVCGYAQMLSMKWQEKNQNPEEIKKLKQIEQGARRAAAVLHAVRDLSKPADEAEADLFEEIDVNEPILDVVELLKGPLVFDHIQLELDLKAQCRILANKIQLERVYTNLVKNAWEAMKETNGEKKIRISSERMQDLVQVIVEDNGPGIPRERLPTLFTPFYTTKKEGTGLGLPSCKVIIEGHRGKIRCVSQVGKGTKFIMELPVYERRLKRGVWRKPR